MTVALDPDRSIAGLPAAVTSVRGAASGLVDDAELVRRALEDDPLAEEAIYRRHVRYVGSIALRLCGRQQDAEDIVQDTFALALSRLDQLREPGALRVWLARIAVSHARRLSRRRRLLRFVGLDEGDEATPLASLCAADAPADARVELARVQRALGRAPADERAAWWLHRVDGETLESTAQICECSLATVKRRVASAEARIAREFCDEVRP